MTTTKRPLLATGFGFTTPVSQHSHVVKPEGGHGNDMKENQNSEKNNEHTHCSEAVMNDKLSARFVTVNPNSHGCKPHMTKNISHGQTQAASN